MATTSAVAGRGAKGTQAAAPARSAVWRKFDAARAKINAALIERESEIDLALTAMVAGENVLLIGPPGCAKSMLFDSLIDWARAAGTPTFSCLMHKGVPVQELMGQVSVKALTELDVYKRNVSGRLPTAALAFLDEIFKSSPVALTPTLRMLNEGVYEDQGQWLDGALKTCFAGSNEWPAEQEATELSALFDRFLFRKEVRYIGTQKGLERLYDFDNAATAGKPRWSAAEGLTGADLDAARAEAEALPWPEATREAFRETVRLLAAEGINPGDRRRKKAVMAARAAAWLAGADEVRPEHLEVLGTVLWDDQAHAVKCMTVVRKTANPVGVRLGELTDEAQQLVAALDMRQPTLVIAAATKLNEIKTRIKELGKEPRVRAAFDEVDDLLKGVHLQSTSESWND